MTASGQSGDSVLAVWEVCGRVAVTAVGLCFVGMPALPSAGVGLLVARTPLGKVVWLVTGGVIGL